MIRPAGSKCSTTGVGLLQDEGHEFTLRLGVSFPTGRVIGGELTLKTGVGGHVVGVSPKVVPKGDVPIEFTTLGKAQVKMVGNIVERRPKRLAAGNPQGAAVQVT